MLRRSQNEPDKEDDEEQIAADQRAFWGEDIDQIITERLQRLESGPRRIMTTEEFLAHLQARIDEVGEQTE